MAKRYVLWFAHEHVDFRHAEMNSLLSLFNINMRLIEEPTADIPFWIVEFETEEAARKIASRSISLRRCVELWGRAKSLDDLHRLLKTSLANGSSQSADGAYSCSREIMEPYFGPDISFKMTVDTFLRHYSNDEKIQKIENFNYLPMEGPVRLKNPDIELTVLEYYGLDLTDIPNDPYDVFIGRQIAEGQRYLISKLSLKNRKFIGNTSMDPQLSLLMANQAQIVDGDIVVDPFVGSGSLLVSAAIFGGYVWGSDIDFLMVHARSRPSRVQQKVREKDESIKANMNQYNIQKQYLDVVVSDFSKPLWKESMKFDAIITDPPYGIRESTEKIGIEKDNYSLSPEHLVNHIPSKVEYNLPHIFCDLLEFAAKHLHVGRRLVCWYPYYREDYAENILPTHECLKLIGNSEQVLSRLTARRLLTYEKFKEREKIIEESKEKLFHSTDRSPSCDYVIDFRQKYFAQGPSKKDKKANNAKDLQDVN